MGLKFPCFANCLFTVDSGILLWTARLWRIFLFDVFRLWVSLVVSTHSTDVICLLGFPGHLHGQGQRVLAGGIRE